MELSELLRRSGAATTSRIVVHLRFAKRLEGHTLREMVDEELPETLRKGHDKGSFGQYIETHYFGYENNNDAEPDFVEAGVELKTSFLQFDARGELVAKERIKLSSN